MHVITYTLCKLHDWYYTDGCAFCAGQAPPSPLEWHRTVNAALGASCLPMVP